MVKKEDLTIFYTLKFLVHEKNVHSEPATSKTVTTGPATIEPATSSEQAVEVKIEEAEKTQIIDIEEGDLKRHVDKDNRIGEAKKQCFQEFKCELCDKCYTTGICSRFFQNQNL